MLVLGLKASTPKSEHTWTSLRYFPSYSLYMSWPTLQRHVWSSYPSAYFSSASPSNANMPGLYILSSPYFSATVSFCYYSLCSNVNLCPHSGSPKDIATEVGQLRLPTHTRSLLAHPIGHSSSCQYSLSIILIFDFVRRFMLGFFWRSAPGMLQ
jgi:hypothetical protein